MSKEKGTEIICPGGVIAVDIISQDLSITGNCVQIAFYESEDLAINPSHSLVPTKKQLLYALGPIVEWLTQNLED